MSKNVNIDLVLNSTRFQNGLKKAVKELNKLENQSKQASKQVDKLDDAFSSIASIGLSVVVGQLSKSIYDVTARFERYEAVLKNSLGSMKKAQDEMKRIKDLASETPYSVDELTDSFIKMVNRGFSPTNEEIIKMSDLASSTGKSFDQLVEAILDAQVGEMERLKEFGIQLRKHGNKVSTTFRNIHFEADNTQEGIRDLILELGAIEGVAGASAERMKTLEGAMSNLKDQTDTLKSVIGNEFKASLKDVTIGISELIKGIIEFKKENPALFSTIVQVSGGVIGLTTAIVGGGGLVIAIRTALLPAITAIGTRVSLTMPYITAISGAILGVVTAITYLDNKNKQMKSSLNNMIGASILVSGEFKNLKNNAINPLISNLETLIKRQKEVENTSSGLFGIGKAKKQQEFNEQLKASSQFFKANNVDIKLTSKNLSYYLDALKKQKEFNKTQSSANKVSNKGPTQNTPFVQKVSKIDFTPQVFTDYPKQKLKQYFSDITLMQNNSDKDFENLWKESFIKEKQRLIKESNFSELSKREQAQALIEIEKQAGEKANQETKQALDKKVQLNTQAWQSIKSITGQALSFLVSGQIQNQAKLANASKQTFSQNLTYINQFLSQGVNERLAAQTEAINSEIQALESKNEKIRKSEESHLKQLTEVYNNWLNDKNKRIDEQEQKEFEKIDLRYNKELEDLKNKNLSLQEQQIQKEAIEQDRQRAKEEKRVEIENKENQLKQEKEKKLKIEKDGNKKKSQKEKSQNLKEIQELNSKKQRLQEKANQEKNDLTKKQKKLEYIQGFSAFQLNKQAQLQSLKMQLATQIAGVSAGIWSNPALASMPWVASALTATYSAIAHQGYATNTAIINQSQYPPPIGFSRGGLVEGGITGVDSVPAMLQPGELVVPRQNFDDVVKSFSKNPHESRITNINIEINVDGQFVHTSDEFSENLVETIKEPLTIEVKKIIENTGTLL